MTSSRWATSAATALLLVACTSNHVVTVVPELRTLEEFLRAEHPRDLRVTTRTDAATWIHSPHVLGDSLVGDAGRDQPPPRRAIPIADIRRLEVPRFSTGRTLGLVGGIVGTAGLAGLIIATSGRAPVY